MDVYSHELRACTSDNWLTIRLTITMTSLKDMLFHWSLCNCVVVMLCTWTIETSAHVLTLKLPLTAVPLQVKMLHQSGLHPKLRHIIMVGGPKIDLPESLDLCSSYAS